MPSPYCTLEDYAFRSGLLQGMARIQAAEIEAAITLLDRGSVDAARDALTAALRRIEDLLTDVDDADRAMAARRSAISAAA